MSNNPTEKLVDLLKRSMLEINNLRCELRDKKSETWENALRREVLAADIFQLLEEIDFYKQYKIGRHD
jgi:hypothetical protein